MPTKKQRRINIKKRRKWTKDHPDKNRLNVARLRTKAFITKQATGDDLTKVKSWLIKRKIVLEKRLLKKKRAILASKERALHRLARKKKLTQGTKDKKEPKK